MAKHRRKSEPVTRREVLRIVQQARDEIISAVVHSSATFHPDGSVTFGHPVDTRSGNVLFVPFIGTASG